MSSCMISIIIPAYNSGFTIEQTLQSIRNQTLDQDQIEILVVDGGSADDTCELAREYGARVLHNVRRLPEIAKQIGIQCARGTYGIFLDSDETFEDMHSLERRLELLQKHSEIKNLVSTGQKCQEHETGINRYANYIGDPFSNFVYRYNGYNRTYDLTRNHAYIKEADAYLFDFMQSEYLPLFDALGNMFEVATARELYHQQGENKSFAANIFSNMVSETKKAAMLENDYVCHRPGLTAARYLSKLRWRVKNNLFQTEGVGFAQRNKREPGLSKRKFLFVPYCALILPVMIDSARMVIQNRDQYFWNHILYTEYTFLMIVWYSFLKMIRYPVKKDKSYGKG